MEGDNGKEAKMNVKIKKSLVLALFLTSVAIVLALPEFKDKRRHNPIWQKGKNRF